MRNVKLPENVNKTYFNCYEQQLMTICQFYYNESWRLFINQHLADRINGTNQIDEKIYYCNQLRENAKYYYGISFVEENDYLHLDFKEKQIYLVYFDLQEYPLSKELDREGMHCALVYSENDKGVMINDNYYGITEFLLSKEDFIKCAKKAEKVLLESKVIRYDKDDVISTLQFSNYKVFQKYVKYVKCIAKREFSSAGLINLISQISSLVKKDSFIVIKWCNEDPFLEAAVMLLDNLAERVRNNYYSILKSNLKYGQLQENLVIKKLEEILVILKCEETIKQEISNVLTCNSSLKDTLHKQVEEYLETEFEDTESVFEVHDEWSIVYLLNYFEKCNELQELEIHDFANCVSYKDYEIIVYKKILWKELQDWITNDRR